MVKSFGIREEDCIFFTIISLMMMMVLVVKKEEEEVTLLTSERDQIKQTTMNSKRTGKKRCPL